MGQWQWRGLKSHCKKKKIKLLFILIYFNVTSLCNSPKSTVHRGVLIDKNPDLSTWVFRNNNNVPSRRSGPSNQACVGPDRPTSSSLVSLYPALGYRAIMQEMSPTAFGEEAKSRLPIDLAVAPDSVWKHVGLRNVLLLARPHTSLTAGLCDVIQCSVVWNAAVKYARLRLSIGTPLTLLTWALFRLRT